MHVVIDLNVLLLQSIKMSLNQNFVGQAAVLVGAVELRDSTKMNLLPVYQSAEHWQVRVKRLLANL
jgi:hypothetical protein